MGFLGVLLLPFTFIYNSVTRFRNYLFDIGFKRSFEFDANVIGVGNLSVGGTGKSPMVEYLIKLLADNYKISTLSRGYGRKTRGFRIANANDSASSIGDEPYQFYNKFKNVNVTVGEERAVAIPHILAELEPDVILMDDAFQHRYVKPGLNIMLTDYSRPFYSDF
ncbi:MAG: tetraacyldisaccharide 4'-kinase, partial [Fulvivirga sp.]